MNKLHAFLGIALICLLYACKGDSVKPQQNPIVGTWKLQEQDITTYINGAVQVHQHSTTGNISNPTITFNTNGSYIATAAYGLDGKLDPLGPTGSAGFSGKYSVADTVITMDPFFVGTMWVDTLLSPQWAITFSNKIITETAKIDGLNSSTFILDTEIDVLQTADNKTRTITTKTSYSYSR